MKYSVLLKKMITKGNQLAKAEKPLVPLEVTLTQKSFNDLQMDIVVNHRELATDHVIVQKDGVFTLTSPAAAIPANIKVVD